MDKLENIAKGIIWGLLVCLLLTILFGCKGKEAVVIPSSTTESAKVMTDSVLMHKVDSVRSSIHDSIFVHDSIFADRWTEGDTIFVREVKERIVERWRTERQSSSHIDSLSHATTDTITRVVTIRVPYTVEAQITNAQRCFITIGKWSCGLLAVMAICGIIFLAMKIKR